MDLSGFDGERLYGGDRVHTGQVMLDTRMFYQSIDVRHFKITFLTPGQQHQRFR